MTKTRSLQIVDRIAAEIAGGKHGDAHDRFMTVRQLAADYDVSLVTAHRVMTHLKQRGLIVGDSTNPAIIHSTAIRRERSETGSQPRRLGTIIPNITNPFFNRLCRHVQQAATAGGYQVLMAESQYDPKRERKAVESFLEIGVEGLLVIPGLDEACLEFYRRLIQDGVRLVLVGRPVENLAADFVAADNFAGSAAVAGHFLTLGYETFGYIGFTARLKKDSRLRGFRAALIEEGLTLDPDRIVEAEGSTVKHGVRAMAQLMEGANRPRAIYAFHDLLAIGALQYCQSHGIAVPQEVAIAGFDNLPETQVTNPQLTTVGYPIDSMARLAVQCLLEKRSETATSSHHILLEPHLIVRGSTDPAAAVLHDSADSTGRAMTEVF